MKNELVNKRLNLDSRKDTIILISPSLASIESMDLKSTNNNVVIVTADYQKYMPENYVIINPEMKNYSVGDEVYINNYVNQKDFHKSISKDEGFRNILGEISQKSKQIYIQPITSTEYLNLNTSGNFKELMPKDKSLKINNKVVQRELLEGVVPLPKGEIFSKKNSENIFNKYLDSKFVVSTGIGGGGIQSIVPDNYSELEKFIENSEENEFVINKWIDWELSPSVNGIIDRFGNVQIYGYAFQNNDDLAWEGSFYNKNLISKTSENKMFEIFKSVGKIFLEKTGYFGGFGIDLVLDKTSFEPYFIEANVRFTAPLAEMVSNAKITDFLDLNQRVLLGERVVPTVYEGVFSWKKQRIFSETHATVVKNISKYDLQKVFSNQGFGIFNQKEEATIFQTGDLMGTVVSVDENYFDVLKKYRDATELLKKSVDYFSLS